MEELKGASINEIERLFKKKKAYVAAIISILSIIIGQLVVIGFRLGTGSRAADRAEFPLLVLSIYINTILPLFTALVTIDMFTGEFSQNTIKIALLRPISRLKLYFSKIIAITFFVFINLLLVMALSTLAGMFFNPGTMSIKELLRILLAYTVSMLPILTITLILVFIANLFKNGVVAFLVSTILYIAMKAFEIYNNSYKIIFITSTLGWYSHWTGSEIPIDSLVREFLVMFACSLMAFSAGFYLFDKKEL